jgi:glycosyltransferase involved in cell wall biosynthesis
MWKVSMISWVGNTWTEKYLRNYSKFRQKVAGWLAVKISTIYWTVLAQGRMHQELLAEAIAVPADLYIAHNLAALPIAVKAAKFHQSKAGFDAEDFHRGELVDQVSLQSQLVRRIEDYYLPQVNHLTAASPLISEAYQKLYPALKAHVINNVFSIQDRSSRLECSTRQSLHLFWFSQTIGNNRGIEDAIQAIGATRKSDIYLHLLGFCTEAMKTYLKNLSTGQGLAADQLVFMQVVAPDQVVRISSQFDIGLALEQGNTLNRSICLTNKIFTYVLAGNAIIASNTQGQVAFMEQYPEIGKTYAIGNIKAFANQIMYFYENREALNECRRKAWELGTGELNWEKEQTKFLALVDSVLS